MLVSVSGRSSVSSLYDAPVKVTTWQEDIVDILKPLADSVKNLTRRPREIAALKEELSLIDARANIINLAMDKFVGLEDDPSLSPAAKSYIDTLVEEWRDELAEMDGEQLIVSGQLRELTVDDQGSVGSFLPKLKSFLVGTGLTLILCGLVAFLLYLIMRAGWWLYSNKVVSKDVRRKSTSFRVFSYSYQLITFIVMVLSVFFVIYCRDDLLLFALAGLLLAGLLFNLKWLLPRYITEAKLLLNLGSVREEERVIYNGLPWQVKSLNLYSVLHNPALDGIAKLPLSAMHEMVSRPVKNKLWFPTQRGGYVILPDGSFGRVKTQTPDLVELTVRGGMTQIFTASEFYALSVISRSKEETFGTSIVFGLDYSLQKISVSEIPQTLKDAVVSKLNEQGYEKTVEGLIVELSEANASSLDCLIYGTFNKKCSW